MLCVTCGKPAAPMSRYCSVDCAFGIPADRNFPADAVQCDCGGYGCHVCDKRGWLPAGHKNGRTCARHACRKPIKPSSLAVYCSNECAFLDA